MINKLKKEDANVLVFPAGKILVLGKRVRTRLVEHTVPVEQPKDVNEEVKTKVVKSKEPYYIQFYEVIGIAKDDDTYNIGDVIMASSIAGVDFDLINKARLINKFDVIGKYIGE